MFSRIFWIPSGTAGQLAILPRPAAEWLAEEVAAWRQTGLTTVVSLLEPEEQAELDLRDEATQCRAQRIDFISFPIADRGVPASREEAIALARRLARAIEAGGGVGVHCRAGIGRSAIVAASVLIAIGQSPASALDAIAAARGVRVPDTPEQRDWIGAMQTATW